MSRARSIVDRRVDVNVQATLAALPIAAYSCDSTGRITGFNERARELWGRRPDLNDASERFCGSVSLLTAEGTPVAREESWTALALQDGSSYEGREAVVVRPDGSRRNVLVYVSPLHDDSGKLAGAVTTLVDITEHVDRGLWRRDSDGKDVVDMSEEKAKAALQASEANFRGFFESVAIGAVQVGKDGRFMRVNDRYCEITGYSRDELLRMGPLDPDHPDDREADQERVAKFIDGTDPFYRAEKRYIRKDGSVTWVRVAANLLRDATPGSFHSAAIVEDISERKLAEQALQDAD